MACKTGHRLVAALWLLWAGLVSPVQGEIIINGTLDDREKIALWLSIATHVNVTVNAAGKMFVPPDGNPTGVDLKIMAEDPTWIVLHVINKTGLISYGRWNDANGTTSGIQDIDLVDISELNNDYNEYGYGPAAKLMHAITEVFVAKNLGYAYSEAHQKGVEAEIKIMQLYGTKWIGPRYLPDPEGRTNINVKQQDGSQLFARFEAYRYNQDTEWLTEILPGATIKGLFAMVDSTQQVRLMNYDLDGNHSFEDSIEVDDGAMTGVAFDRDGKIYVAVDLFEGPDELRIYKSNGFFQSSISGPELEDPEGVDVDTISGEVFMAVDGEVIRYSNTLEFLGTYDVQIPNFDPSDVAVWRNDGTNYEDISGLGDRRMLFVTDRTTSMVYGFDIELDMNVASHTLAFGAGYILTPEGISVDEWDVVWVASTGNHRICRFSTDGVLLRKNNRNYVVEDLSRTFLDVTVVDFDGIYVLSSRESSEMLLYSLNGQLQRSYELGNFQNPVSLDTFFHVDSGNLRTLRQPGVLTPTVSHWGIVIMALFFLVGGKLHFGRRFLLAP
ncbi:MAG: SMP-30/gluconolactonase/LRE family protein [Planctomycetota bacterium]